MVLPKLGRKIMSGLKSLIVYPQLYLYRFSKPVLISFVLLFVILMIPVLVGSDYESILRVAEFTIIGSGTLAILTFTYALVKKEGTKVRNKIVKSGEHFFQCSITLIIGLGLLPLVGYLLRNHITLSSPLGIFAAVYDNFLGLLTLFIMVIGIFSLFISASFLIFGIRGLIELFEIKSQH